MAIKLNYSSLFQLIEEINPNVTKDSLECCIRNFLATKPSEAFTILKHGEDDDELHFIFVFGWKGQHYKLSFDLTSYDGPDCDSVMLELVDVKEKVVYVYE